MWWWWAGISYGLELPIPHHTRAPIEASSTFLRRILDVFFAETVPTSSMANPVCICNSHVGPKMGGVERFRFRKV